MTEMTNIAKSYFETQLEDEILSRLRRTGHAPVRGPVWNMTEHEVIKDWKSRYGSAGLVPSGRLDPLRVMLEDAYETVAMPGKYCDPMAYVLDNSLAACDADDELSLGLGGDYYARYGKFVLHIDDRGFVESWSFKSKVLAGVEMELLRHDWRDEDDDEGEENDPLGPLEA